MPNTKDESYEAEWDEQETGLTLEEYKLQEAYKSLASDAMSMVNESIRARNSTTFSQEIKRAFQLYNATSIDKTDLLDGWEGTRTAVQEGSKVIQNIVRQIANDGASQLGDMLFPNDQDNYGVVPIYPARPPVGIQDEQAVTADGRGLEDAEGNPITHKQAWEARKASLLRRVERMATNIDGTLERNQYGKIGRALIHDGAITGTAILKGPFVDYSESHRWVRGESSWEMEKQEAQLAAFKRISVLDFLPDMSAEEVDNCAYTSVREWYLPRNMRKLLGAKGYNKAAIAALLNGKPRQVGEGSEEGDDERLSIKDQALVQDMYSKRFEVFETWGDFDYEDLVACGVKNLPSKKPPGGQVTACVIHCQGYVLKAFLNPLPSGKLPFSVWCWDEDPTSIFGKGVPILCENSQMIYNAVWRMILDHGGLGAVPMITMIQDKIEPAGKDKSDYSIKGGKIWLAKADLFNLPDGKVPPFQVHEIPIHLDQFFAIMEKAEEDAYKLSGVTRVEKNQQGVDNAPVTLGATAIYQNNSAVSRRRQVRDFDDDITKSALTGLYDWFMKYSPDSESKGPMEIEPRGSSVLMQREVNTQNLMQLYTLTINGSTEGAKPVEMLREIESGMQFPGGRFIESADETADRRAREAENPPVAPEIQLEYEQLTLKRDTVEADVEIKFLAQQLNEAKVEAEIELRRVADERTHYREMMKLELMSETEGNRFLLDLQKREDAVNVTLQTKMSEIQSRRDIAASAMLQKESQTEKDTDAKMLTAIAKNKEADTKASELSNKLAGNIKQGV